VKHVFSRGESSIHIGFGWPVAVLLTLPFSSVAMRLGPVMAGPVHSCVGAAGRFAAVCGAGGGGGGGGVGGGGGWVGWGVWGGGGGGVREINSSSSRGEW